MMSPGKEKQEFEGVPEITVHSVTTAIELSAAGLAESDIIRAMNCDETIYDRSLHRAERTNSTRLMHPGGPLGVD
jgi:hypothetical protein